MPEPKFHGTITALVTPFRDGKIDYDALHTLVRRQVDVGVEGLVVCGTSGEMATLTPEEQREILIRAKQATEGKASVLAGTGSASTERAIALSREAADAGADGLLIISPYHIRPSQEGLYLHFSAIAKAVRIPIVLYNIPRRTGVEIEVPTIARLTRDHDNIVAVKHATGRVIDAVELFRACDIHMLSGTDALTLPLMSLGAVGTISSLANLAPKMVKRLTDAMYRGDLVRAQVAHRVLYPLARAVLSLASNPVPIKTALAIKGLCAEEFRCRYARSTRNPGRSWKPW